MEQPKNSNKNRTIIFRVSEKEHNIITKRADKCNKNLSEYLRDVIMDNRTPLSFMVSVNHTLSQIQDIINHIRDNHELTPEEIEDLNRLEEEICQV